MKPRRETRLQRCEERIAMLETAIHANQKLLRVWQAEVIRDTPKTKKRQRVTR
jgi:nicotinic acid mononucleotide adenylyltransferase